MTEAPPLPQDSTTEAAGLSPESFARLAGFVTAELGIRMPESKLTMVQSRLLRRVRDLNLRSVNEYAEYLFTSADRDEREQFVNAITTNKTDFFREPDHFDYLASVVLPAWTDDAAHGPRFQAWSAGCSSGEEPYTLAMVMAEHARVKPGFHFAILATDVSTRVLNAARNAIYQESQVLPVPSELRSRYLLRGRQNSAGLVRIVPELRGKVGFHRLNFMDESYPIRDTFDAIFFRNVMIYFDKFTQETVINRICRHLAPGGYLFTGHSESLAGLDVPLRAITSSMHRRIG